MYFTTANRGLAAALILNGHQPVRATRNDAGKPALEFEKTDAMMTIFGMWKDAKLVGKLTAYNDCMFEVHKLLKEVA